MPLRPIVPTAMVDAFPDSTWSAIDSLDKGLMNPYWNPDGLAANIIISGISRNLRFGDSALCGIPLAHLLATITMVSGWKPFQA